MTKPHRIGNQDFFNILSKIEAANSESMFSFPLEYYNDEKTSQIVLYKIIESVCLKTAIMFSKDSEDSEPYVLFNETPYTYDQFITMLSKNYRAIALLEDISEEFSLRRL